MKKSLSIILVAAVLIGSLLGINAFAQESKTRTQLLFESVETADAIAVSLEAGNIDLYEGASMGASDTFYVTETQAAYDYETGFLKVRVLVDNGKVYAYLPTLPYFHVKIDEFEIPEINYKKAFAEILGVTYAFLHYVETYEEEINGITYTVEEFNDNAQVTSKFYYDEDDQLKILYVTDAQTGSVNRTNFESISFNVDDSVFDVPVSFDISPILKWLFMMLISA